MTVHVKLLQPDYPSPEDWLPFLQESYDQHWYSNFGPNALKLAEEAAHFLDSGRSVSLVSSATSGLTATLLALGVKGKVALPAFTFPATASAVFQAGCQPVAVDSNLETWEMSAAALRLVLEQDDFAAVIHVRSFGYCRDITEIERAAADYKLPLIVDAAAAFGGADSQGQLVGRSGAAEVFSLHATKPFSVGEGGMVVGPPDLIDEINKVINFSLAGGKASEYWGINAKMSEVTASIGRAALRQLPAIVNYRNTIAELYAELLQSDSGFGLPNSIGRPAWQLFSLKLAKDSSEYVRDQLQIRGYQTRVYYSPPVNSRWGDLSTPQAEILSRSMLALPIGRHLTSSVQEELCLALSQIHKDFCARASKS